MLDSLESVNPSNIDHRTKLESGLPDLAFIVSLNFYFTPEMLKSVVQYITVLSLYHDLYIMV